MDILTRLFTSVLYKLDKDTIKMALDKALDVVESRIEKSETKLDDQFIIPAIKWLREQLDIVENPGTVFEDKKDA